MAVLYLLATSICDTIWVVFPSYLDKPLDLKFQLILKLLLILLESRGKEDILLDTDEELPPEETSGVLSRTFFWWIHGVLIQGYNNNLLNDELPSPDTSLASATVREALIQTWNAQGNRKGKLVLPRVLMRCFATPLASAILPRLFLILFRFGQPLLINQSIQFIKGESRDEADDYYFRRNGYWLVFAAIVVYVGLAISSATYNSQLNKLEVMVRGAVIGLIHQHTLDAQQLPYEDGRVVTLMSNDVEIIEQIATMFLDAWALSLEFVIAVLFLATQVGRLWPVPLILIFFGSYTSRWVARHLKDRQAAWNVATQKRIAVTSSMLGEIKNIKMLGVQAAVEARIVELRRHELDMAKKVRWLMVTYNCSANALGLFAPVLTIVLYAVLAAMRGSPLDAETAFTTVALVTMVIHPANMVMTIVPRAVASVPSFTRIQDYLMEPTNQDQRIVDRPSTTETAQGVQSRGTTPAIQLDHVTITGSPGSATILRDIALQIPRGALVICSGAVGSGKSSLIRAILGEVPPSQGAVHVSSKRMACCSQIPWLPNKSIKECIYGLDVGLPRDREAYNTALKACCILHDLEELTNGDDTIVGHRGSNLSGGQRQRVALARALYSGCELVILDDSLSGLDGKTQSQVVENLFGSDGVFRKRGQSVLWITSASQYFHLADKVVILGDSVIQEEGRWESLSSAAAQLIQPSQNQPELTDDALRVAREVTKGNALVPGLQGPLTDSKLSRRDGDSSLYSYYIKSAGVGNVLLMMFTHAVYSVFATFPQYWLKWWTESGSAHLVFYSVGYVLQLFIAWVATSSTGWTIQMLIAQKSGVVLHGRLLASIMGAPLSYFSASNSGTILNRFSQDLQLVDRTLGNAIGSLTAQVFKMTAQMAVLLAVQYYISLSLPFCFAIVYVVQKVYLRTSRQLRLLELESRSGVYSSFLETVQGVSTIRAFGWKGAVAADNMRCVDDSHKPFYLLMCLQRWLNVVLNLLMAFIAVATIWLAVAFRDTTTGAALGVALNVILVANTTLLTLVSSWTELEISLGAVARLKQVKEETPQEDLPAESLLPEESWPAAGEVEFVDVTAAYNENAVALRQINLKISPGQTVVICGRTGSGKSSLLLSLLRLIELQSGRILIDGTDLRTVPRSTIRQRCFITVTQDPFLLPNASLHFNLDPSETLPAAALAAALRKTDLLAPLFGPAAAAAPHTLPFDRPLAAFPALSVGQAQLLALARALLQLQSVAGGGEGGGAPRPRPVLLLDEVTAALDPATEAKVYDVVREEVVDRGHSVVMVTHKLGAFAGRMRPGRDRVVWMRDGRVERVDEVGGELVDTSVGGTE